MIQLLDVESINGETLNVESFIVKSLNAESFNVESFNSEKHVRRITKQRKSLKAEFYKNVEKNVPDWNVSLV